MTCEQLGGACDKAFQAGSFEEIAEQSKQHALEMLQQQDKAHLQAMNQMKALMKEPGAMEAWYEHRKKEFDAMPEE